MDEYFVETLKTKFSYCNMIDFEAFPSINPEFRLGYIIKCKLYDKNITSPEDCKNCWFLNTDFRKISNG